MEFEPIAFNLENAGRHLLDYLPPFLRQVEEFAAINAASEPEIRLAWQGAGRVLGNQFLEDADGGGLAVWERELGIFAKDTDSLSLRRARIKAAWQRQPPYTLRWLRGLLDGLCGAGNYTANVQDYTINILLDYDKLAEPGALLREILEVLRPIRPANMQLCPAMAVSGVWPEYLNQRFILHSLQLPFYFSNQPNDITLLNGRRRLDGGWLLDSTFRGVVMQSVGLYFRFANLGKDLVLLNGRRKLNGGWLLNQTIRGSSMLSVGFGNIRLSNHNQSYGPGITLAGSFANSTHSDSRSLALGSKFAEKAGAMGGAEFVKDTMWRLGGAFRLDGSNKLNAAIVKEEL